jgi:hypothetical protein
MAYHPRRNLADEPKMAAPDCGARFDQAPAHFCQYN